MKKTVIILLVFAMLATMLVGCTDTSVDTEEPTSAETDATVDTEQATETEATSDEMEKPLTIGLAMNAADEFRTLWLKTMSDLCEAKGYTVYSTNADSDANQQVADVESLLTRGCDVIIVTPTTSGVATDAVAEVYDAGVPVIVVDFTVEGDKYSCWYGGQVVTSGKIAGEYLQSWLDEDSSRVANVGYIVGYAAMSSTRPRINLTLEACPDANILAEAEGEFASDKAMAVTEAWLQAFPEMNVFVCMNDEMAIGVIQAINAAGIDHDDVVIIGSDGLEAGQKYIRSGELDATAVRDIGEEVSTCLEIAEKLVNGESVEQDITPTSLQLLTLDNIDEIVGAE